MAEENVNSRLEAFCDAVFAIALTLLIIDIKIPAGVKIETTNDFWLALKHLVPSLFAFVLSFTIIFITWVNHHNSLRLVNKSSSSFIYANGLLLLTVVFLPFPTALLGESLLTDHAAPAVILYDATMAFQAVSWILLTRTTLRHHLSKNEKSTSTIRENSRYGYAAFTVYSLCAVLACWYPLTVAIVTTLIWIFWLILSMRLKQE